VKVCRDAVKTDSKLFFVAAIYLWKWACSSAVRAGDS